jgi:branched-chain amino acid transport system substrate-binding protein
VTFLSGPAAESFGVPAKQGGDFIIEQLNKGTAPAPYDKVGFGGMRIEPLVIDENGGATKQVQELRNLYQRENVDAVIGYIGSGDCLAVAPVAEELKSCSSCSIAARPASSRRRPTNTSSAPPRTPRRITLRSGAT